MRKIVATSATAATAAVAVGVFSIGYSPVGCSCIDPLTVLASQAYGRVTHQTDLSPKAIEGGLNRSLQGTAVSFGAFPYTAADGCTQHSADRIVCNVPIERSMVLTRGYRVTYTTANGLFINATVERATWL